MKPAKPKESPVPADLRRALGATPKIETLWQSLTPIARRDFVTWIESAKQSETRKRRIEVTCDKLAKGERRPCCYAVVPMPLYRALGANAKAKATWSTLTPDERRDWVAWVEGAADGETRKQSVAQACAKLATGKRQP